MTMSSATSHCRSILNLTNELNSGEVTLGHIMVSRYGIVHLLSG